MVERSSIRIVQEQVRLSDPHAITDSRTLLNTRAALYDALVQRVGPGMFQPALATTWTCESDARTWTFALRDGVRFHDGRRLSAHDVAASISRAISPAAGGEMATEGVLASYLEDASVEALAGDRLRIVTGRPIADLLDLLVDIVVLPGGEPVADVPVGSGPFRLSASSDDAIEMEAFDGYWGDSVPFSRLHWLAEPDSRERAQRLADGGADLAVGLGADGRSTVGSLQNVERIESPGALCVAFLFNAATGASADPRVRQALNYAVDVDRIITDVAHGAARPLNGPLTPLHTGHDPSVPRYRNDPELARALLADAGYRDDLELTVDVPTRLPDEALALAHHLTQAAGAIGVTVTIRTHTDRLAYARMVRAKQIGDACCFDSSPLSTYRVLCEKLHSGIAGPWWQGYANADIDALIDRAAATVDDAARHALYQRAYRLIRNDAPWLFLYQPSMLDGVGPALSGWRPAINGVARFERR